MSRPLFAVTLLLRLFAGCNRPSERASDRALEASASKPIPSASVAALPDPAVDPPASTDAPASTKAGFIAFANDARWDTAPAHYTATLADGLLPIALAARGDAATAAAPREIMVDFHRHDGDRVTVRLKVVKDFVGRHRTVCNANRCSGDFEAQLYRASARELYWVRDGSEIELTKFARIDAQTARASFVLDLRFRSVRSAKSKPVRIVGAAENVDVIDIDAPVGLMQQHDAEMGVLGIEHLPERLRPPKSDGG
jgi:hypothetical protein